MNDDLILNNEKLIYYVLGKMNLYEQREDYYDIGMIGLIKAAKTYVPNKGIVFSTYAVRCIKNEVLIEIRKEKSNKRKVNYNCVSLEQPVNGNDDEKITIGDTLKSNIDIEKEMIRKEERELLYKSLSKLSDKEQFVINHYYGLNGCEKLKQEELAKILNVQQGQISRIKNKSIQKLKMMIEEGI